MVSGALVFSGSGNFLIIAYFLKYSLSSIVCFLVLWENGLLYYIYLCASSSKCVDLSLLTILVRSGSVNSKLHSNVEPYFLAFFLLGGKFYVDIWGMTIARHGEKLNRMDRWRK